MADLTSPHNHETAPTLDSGQGQGYGQGQGHAGSGPGSRSRPASADFLSDGQGYHHHPISPLGGDGQGYVHPHQTLGDGQGGQGDPSWGERGQHGAHHVPVPLAERVRMAASKGQLDHVTSLLQSGASLDPDRDGRTALHYAAQNGNVEVCKVLVAKGINIDAEDVQGYTALHRAAAQGHLQVVQLLLEEGCSLDCQDENGNAALHEAAWNGYSKTMEALVKHNANVFLSNKAGFTALHLAAQNGHNESSRVLLYAGCNADIKNNYGDTALHTAARYGHAGVTRILLSARCKMNEQNKNGDTALHIAAALKRRKIAKLLVDAGIDSSIRNKQNETAVDVAKRKDHPEIILIVTSNVKHRPPGPGIAFKDELAIEEGPVVVPDDDPPTKQDKGEKLEKDRWFSFFKRKKKQEKDKGDKGVAGQPATAGGRPMGQRVAPATKTPVVGFFSQYAPRPGLQYYRDLAGNVKQGPIGYTPVCQCVPVIKRLEQNLDSTRDNLYEHIEAGHQVLREQIEHIDRRTSHAAHATEHLMRQRLDAESQACHDRITQRLKAERQETEHLVSQYNSNMANQISSWLEDRLASYGHCLDHHHDDLALPSRNIFFDIYNQPGGGRLFRSRSDETLSASDYSGKHRKKDFYASRQAAMQQIRGWNVPNMRDGRPGEAGGREAAEAAAAAAAAAQAGREGGVRRPEQPTVSGRRQERMVNFQLTQAQVHKDPEKRQEGGGPASSYPVTSAQPPTGPTTSTPISSAGPAQSGMGQGAIPKRFPQSQSWQPSGREEGGRGLYGAAGGHAGRESGVYGGHHPSTRLQGSREASPYEGHPHGGRASREGSPYGPLPGVQQQQQPGGHSAPGGAQGVPRSRTDSGLDRHTARHRSSSGSRPNLDERGLSGPSEPPSGAREGPLPLPPYPGTRHAPPPQHGQHATPTPASNPDLGRTTSSRPGQVSGPGVKGSQQNVYSQSQQNVHSQSQQQGVYSSTQQQSGSSSAQQQGVYSIAQQQSGYSSTPQQGVYSSTPQQGVYSSTQQQGVYSNAQQQSVYSNAQQTVAQVHSQQNVHSSFQLSGQHPSYSQPNSMGSRYPSHPSAGSYSQAGARPGPQVPAELATRPASQDRLPSSQGRTAEPQDQVDFRKPSQTYTPRGDALPGYRHPSYGSRQPGLDQNGRPGNQTTRNLQDSPRGHSASPGRGTPRNSSLSPTRDMSRLAGSSGYQGRQAGAVTSQAAPGSRGSGSIMMSGQTQGVYGHQPGQAGRSQWGEVHHGDSRAPGSMEGRPPPPSYRPRTKSIGNVLSEEEEDRARVQPHPLPRSRSVENTLDEPRAGGGFRREQQPPSSPSAAEFRSRSEDRDPRPVSGPADAYGNRSAPFRGTPQQADVRASSAPREGARTPASEYPYATVKDVGSRAAGDRNAAKPKPQVPPKPKINPGSMYSTYGQLNKDHPTYMSQYAFHTDGDDAGQKAPLSNPLSKSEGNIAKSEMQLLDSKRESMGGRSGDFQSSQQLNRDRAPGAISDKGANGYLSGYQSMDVYRRSQDVDHQFDQYRRHQDQGYPSNPGGYRYGTSTPAPQFRSGVNDPSVPPVSHHLDSSVDSPASFRRHDNSTDTPTSAYASHGSNKEDSTCSSNPDSGYSSKNYARGTPTYPSRGAGGAGSTATPSSSFSTDRSVSTPPGYSHSPYPTSGGHGGDYETVTPVRQHGGSANVQTQVQSWYQQKLLEAAERLRNSEQYGRAPSSSYSQSPLPLNYDPVHGSDV